MSYIPARFREGPRLTLKSVSTISGFFIMWFNALSRPYLVRIIVLPMVVPFPCTRLPIALILTALCPLYVWVSRLETVPTVPITISKFFFVTIGSTNCLTLFTVMFLSSASSVTTTVAPFALACFAPATKALAFPKLYLYSITSAPAFLAICAVLS